MTTSLRTLTIAMAGVLSATLAHADITIGVSLPLTGPTSALGIPCKNGIALWPTTVAGEKLNVIILDDATDPTIGVKNASEAESIQREKFGKNTMPAGSQSPKVTLTV